jgi:hypothetical protein
MTTAPDAARAFGAFRILFGAYLAIHFAMLIPYAPQVWGFEGQLPDPALNFTHGLIPNPLDLPVPSWALQAFLGGLTLLSLALAAGLLRPLMSLLLWLGWVWLFNRNNLIANPGIPYVGWLLLACALIPGGEPYRIFRLGCADDTAWEMPRLIRIGAWVLLGLGYTLSGFDKMASPSWMDGSAMHHLLDNPLARDWALRDLAASLPDWALRLKTWAVLALEVLFGPLCLIPRLRKWAWLAMVGMHFGILSVVSFADLTAGMLMMHAFVFEARWNNAWRRVVEKRT